MEVKKTIRNSNYELLRITSMFLIVIFHIIKHGHVVENYVNGGLKILVLFIEYFTIVHVNSFVLVTGYYQSEKKFKFSKVWSLIGSSLFYKILTVIILTSIGAISLSKLEILKQLFILNLDQYWFVKTYLFLYCLSPFINKLIQVLTKNEYLKLLGTLFIIFSIIPFITGCQGFDNNGFTLYNFIFLYFIGGYLKKYPIEKNYIFRRLSKQLLQLSLIFIFFISIIFNICLYTTLYTFKDANSIFAEMYRNIEYMLILYSNPIVLIQSIAFFAFFSTLNIKSKIINKISSLTLGIYLIHDNNYTRTRMYKWLKIDNGYIYSYRFLIYMFVIAVLIFVVCLIIEQLRQLLFKFIYNRKISNRIRIKYKNWINNIKIIN